MSKLLRIAIAVGVVAAVAAGSALEVLGCSRTTPYLFVNVASVPLHIKWGKLTEGGYEFEMAPGAGAYCSYYEARALVEISTKGGPTAHLDVAPIFRSHWVNDSICVLPIDQTGKVSDVTDIEKMKYGS